MAIMLEEIIRLQQKDKIVSFFFISIHIAFYITGGGGICIKPLLSKSQVDGHLLTHQQNPK